MSLFKNKLFYIILLSIFMVALIVSISVTLAYFGKNRSFSGTLNFSDGVKVDYFNVEYENNSSFNLLKLGKEDDYDQVESISDLSVLNESSTSVKSEDKFYIAIPKIKANPASADFFVRYKFEILTDQQSGAGVLERALTNEELINVFGSTDIISENAVTDNAGFLKKGDYYYLVNANVLAITSFSDLHSLSKDIDEEFNLFQKDGTQAGIDYFVVSLNNGPIEEFLVDNFKIKITVEAIDVNAGDVWGILD